MGIENVAYLGLEGLIHHSDRGVQYCCNRYIEHLEAINASISMTEGYKPTDNAIAERVNGIIKQEWLYRMKRPHDLEEARGLVAAIIEFYNTKRPHRSNRDMLPPRRMREVAPCTLKGSMEASHLQPQGFHRGVFHDLFALPKKTRIFAPVNRIGNNTPIL